MQKFHAHVYFQDHEIVQIKQLKLDAESSPLSVWNLFEACVGPHSRPMLELHFTLEDKAPALRWLEANRGSFSVLVHEDTGDDVKDHEHVLWLGEKLPLHFHFFDQVKANPNLAIHAVS